MPRRLSRKRRRSSTLPQQLEAGGRNSLGRANAVSAAAAADRSGFRQVIAGMWHDDPVVRMRAADAAEKASSLRPTLLGPFKAELLSLMNEARQQELRWHLCAMVPRLPLAPSERHTAAAAFRDYLNDRSSIVRTFALQALYDLAQQEPSLRDEVVELLHAALKSGTAAMKARARKLLKQAEPTRLRVSG